MTFTPELLGTIAVQLMGYGALVQRVRDQGKQIDDHEQRLRKLEPKVLSQAAGR